LIDFLSKLIADAKRRIDSGYYDVRESAKHEPVSLRVAIKAAAHNAVIAEIKPISPARGPLRTEIDPLDTAARLTKGGAIALSILTEPDNFGGSLENLRRIRAHTRLPLLMKDIIIDEKQIEAARKVGADCVLLIESAFSRYNVGSLNNLLNVVHQNGLEALLEVHNQDELNRALKSGADILGVNNRNLATLEIDLGTTTRLTAGIADRSGKTIISESGLETADDVRRLKPTKVDGFLIGSSIMQSQDPETKVREFVFA
jgi:indole-3-glycerol phosphate synthase